MPTFRAKADAASASVTNFVINKPTGVVANDVLVAAMSVFGSTITTPSGWSLLTGFPEVVEVGAGSFRRLYVFTKLAGASEPGSYTFTLSGAAQVSGGIAAYSGCDTADYLDASNGNTGGGGANPHITSIGTGTITPSLDGCTIVGVFGADVYNSVGPASWTVSGATERFDLGDTNTFMTTALVDFDQTTAAAVSKTGTISADSAAAMAAILALAPPAGPPPGTVIIPETERDAMVADMDLQITSLTNTVDDMTAVRDQLAAYPVS